MTQVIPDSSDIALIGVPSSAGARMAGQEQAPKALRAAGLVQSLESAGVTVLDLGDTQVHTYTPDRHEPKQQNLDAVVDVLKQVAARVSSAVSDGKWPLVIGGDCTITIGVLAALCSHYANVGMIYLDGDVDLNTPETTVTGILDGMVLAHILGNGAPELSRFGPRHPMIDAVNIALFGYSRAAGGIDPVEEEQLEVTMMDKYPLEHLADGFQDAATRATSKLESGVDHILVHFDVDVIDEKDFPAVDVPHNPGLKLEQVQEALSIFLESPSTIGLVVTEFNASRDRDGRLARRLVKLISVAKETRRRADTY